MQSPRQTAIARKLRRNDSWAEKLMWSWLRDRRFACYKFRREYPLGGYLLDFFCLEARLNIELDGFQHGFPDGQRSDSQRDNWLETHGVKVLRFWNSQLRREKQFIRDVIWRNLYERAPHPLPHFWRPGSCSRNEAPANAEVG